MLVLPDWVAPTGLPVASTGLFEVPTLLLPAVLDRLGAMLPELFWPALLVELPDLVVLPAMRLPAGAVLAGVVCACAVKPTTPATASAIKSLLIMMVN